MKLINPGSRVLVDSPNCTPFEGEVTFAGKWTNPMSAIRKEGIDYHVKADDDGHTYKDIDDRHVTKIK